MKRRSTDERVIGPAMLGLAALASAVLIGGALDGPPMPHGTVTITRPTVTVPSAWPQCDPADAPEYCAPSVTDPTAWHPVTAAERAWLMRADGDMPGHWTGCEVSRDEMRLRCPGFERTQTPGHPIGG
jgi:hypothetical protein